MAPGVERLGAVLAPGAQRGGQRGNPHHLPGARRAALLEQLGAVLRGHQRCRAALPQGGGERRYRVALVRQGGGGRHHLVTRQGAETALQVEPRRRRAGHRDVVRVIRRQRAAQPLPCQQFQAEPPGATPGAVQGMYGAGRRLVVQHETVAAEAGLTRHRDLQPGRGRHRGVGGGAARGQHLQAEQRRLRRRGGHHAAPRQHRRAAADVVNTGRNLHVAVHCTTCLSQPVHSATRETMKMTHAAVRDGRSIRTNLRR